MGNLHFNPSCMKHPKEHKSLNKLPSSRGEIGKCINTDSTLSTPLISLVSSQHKSFNITISITQQILDLQQIISNHSSTNLTESPLSKLPLQKYNKIPPFREQEQKYNNCNSSLHTKTKFITIECDQQMTFYYLLKEFSLIPLLDINAIKLRNISLYMFRFTFSL